MSHRIAHHAKVIVNASQRDVETSLSSELLAVSSVHESDATQLDDCSIAMLVAFFMLLDKWGREVETQ